MKLGHEACELDTIDLQIIAILQEHGRIPLVKLGDQVGLSAPSVIERVKKLEDGGIITGYHASVDARLMGKDVTAFIGVSLGHPRPIGMFEEIVARIEEVLECHHITGEHTVLLKVKTCNTATLEEVIKTIRAIDGVTRTETMVVLSTHTERTQISVSSSRESTDASNGKRHRHGVPKGAVSDNTRAR
jgi:Lrp/AsnC family leucine-responsive transcriptional regulator